MSLASRLNLCVDGHLVGPCPLTLMSTGQIMQACSARMYAFEYQGFLGPSNCSVLLQDELKRQSPELGASYFAS